MTVWGRIWNIPGSLDEELRSSSSLTKEDLRKLQVLQNKCLRLVTNSDYKTPTKVLLQKTKCAPAHGPVELVAGVQHLPQPVGLPTTMIDCSPDSGMFQEL